MSIGGRGGVITPILQIIQPWVWQYAQQKDIQNELVSYTNPKVTLMEKYIELEGLGLGWLVLEYVAEYLTFKHIVSFCNNISSVAWKNRGSTLTSIPAARLLWLLAIKKKKSSSLIPMRVVGKDNTTSHSTQGTAKMIHAQTSSVNWLLHDALIFPYHGSILGHYYKLDQYSRPITTPYI